MSENATLLQAVTEDENWHLAWIEKHMREIAAAFAGIRSRPFRASSLSRISLTSFFSVTGRLTSIGTRASSSLSSSGDAVFLICVP